ncbi:MAG: hypothetical protein KGL35_17880 [Bradyrhizobium sp.]|nr:hypothetical protein [Bradyrhizobium sp.]
MPDGTAIVLYPAYVREARQNREDRQMIGNATKATFRILLGRADIAEADNDPVTVHQHPDANILFANLLRAKQDWIIAQHSATEAREQAVSARISYEEASNAMMQLFVDHDLVDRPLPECPQPLASPAAED